MAIDVYFVEEIRSRLLAAIVLAVRTANASGANVEYVRGALALAEHQALAFDVSWPGLLADARQALVLDAEHPSCSPGTGYRALDGGCTLLLNGGRHVAR